jgi:Arc/MetJ family transcription regulator
MRPEVRIVSPVKDKAQVKRTSLNLDFSLVHAAEDALGTHGTTETVRSALQEVVARRRRKQLADWDLGGMTGEDFEQLRQPRVA